MKRLLSSNGPRFLYCMFLYTYAWTLFSTELDFFFLLLNAKRRNTSDFGRDSLPKWCLFPFQEKHQISIFGEILLQMISFPSLYCFMRKEKWCQERKLREPKNRGGKKKGRKKIETKAAERKKKQRNRRGKYFRGLLHSWLGYRLDKPGICC